MRLTLRLLALAGTMVVLSCGGGGGSEELTAAMGQQSAAWVHRDCNSGDDSASVTPEIVCVGAKPDGTQVAVLGYSNAASRAVTVPLGPDNGLRVASGAAGPPATFEPGRHAGVVVPLASDGTLTWHVGTRSVSAAGKPSCERVVDGKGQPWSTRLQELSDPLAKKPGSDSMRTSETLGGTGTVPGTLTGSLEVDSAGQAQYTVPLPVPPGRGISPQLVLQYRSDGSNQSFGTGWSLTGTCRYGSEADGRGEKGRRQPLHRDQDPGRLSLSSECADPDITIGEQSPVRVRYQWALSTEVDAYANCMAFRYGSHTVPAGGDGLNLESITYSGRVKDWLMWQFGLVAPVGLQEDAIDVFQVDDFGSIADGFEQGAEA